jgi:hypothetical protein
MRLEFEDLYINCDDLIIEANELYLKVIQKDLSFDDLRYIQSTNRYINNYTKYRKKLINDYIDDLRKMISE